MAYVPQLDPCDLEGIEMVGDTPEGAVDLPAPAPVPTGLLDSEGRMIWRHPVVTRVGFHPPSRATHIPSLEDEHFDDQPICGWVYTS